MTGLRYICFGLFIISASSLAQQTGAGHEFDGVDLKETRVQGTASPVAVEINEDRVVKPFSREMFGYNYTWYWMGRLMLNGDVNSPEYSELMHGVPLPLNRVAGGDSKTFKWKDAIGPLSERQPQRLVKWAEPEIVRVGPVEWIQSTLAVDKDARFTWTFNIDTDSVQDNVDLVEFLTGDPSENAGGGVNWAAKRVELGLTNPVNVVVWELGNEMDWGETRHRYPVDVYIAKCKAVIAAVKNDFPKAKFAAHAATAPSNKIHEKVGGWSVWHRRLLAELGDQIDFVVVHPYYQLFQIPGLERDCVGVLAQDIRDITGSDRIKIYISEHARWPVQKKGRPWEETYYKSHSLEGCLTVAEFCNRMLNVPSVTKMTYHCFTGGGPWGVMCLDKQTGRRYTTGIFDLFKLLNTISGIDVVQNTVSGENTDVKSAALLFTVSAITTGEGLDLILINADSENSRNATFKFNRTYRLAGIDTLTAPNMDSFNTVNHRPIQVASETLSDTEVFSHYHVPAKSMVLLHLTDLPDVESEH